MKEAGSPDRIGAAGWILLAEGDGAPGDWHAAAKSTAPASAIQRNLPRPIWPERISGPRPKARRRVGPARLQNQPAPPSGAGCQSVDLLGRRFAGGGLGQRFY